MGGADEGGSRLADEEVLDAVEPADVTAAGSELAAQLQPAVRSP